MSKALLPDSFYYSLTLQKAGAITGAIYGNFSAPKAQEIFVSRGKILELLRPDDESGRVMSVVSWECFGTIRSMQPFRLTGGNRDYVVIGSDSGKIVVLQYNVNKNALTVIHNETYGKSGCRRIVPGEYMACDPKGRALMIGAVEKCNFVYILNRDANAKLIISSPLEAHKSNVISFDMCGVDVGYDNPMFAVLEIDYEDVERELQDDPRSDPMQHKLLTWYELDLGLNHVTRKNSVPVDPGANMLMTVPGGDDGPGGVLVCSENYILYYHPEAEQEDEIRAPIPRRAGFADEKGLLLTCYATHKQRDLFFFLVQSELGDIYKVTLSYHGEDVHDIHIKYFDSTPVASAMCVLKTGYLFLACEFGNHFLFTFKGIGEDDETAETNTETGFTQFVYFQPRVLTNLQPVDEMLSLAPITKMRIDYPYANVDKNGQLVPNGMDGGPNHMAGRPGIDQTLGNLGNMANLGNIDFGDEKNMELHKLGLLQDVPNIYCLCGRGPRSTLRILKHGLNVSEMAQSPIPGSPNAVWSVQQQVSDSYHKYIVVSFLDATMVLSIGDKVEEVQDSGFLDNTMTLLVQLLGNNIVMQAHPRGLRLIHIDGRVKEWKPPTNKRIVKVAANNRQVLITMSGNEIVYFELNNHSQLTEMKRKVDFGLDKEILGICIAPITKGTIRSRWCAIATDDNAVRVLSLEQRYRLEIRSTQLLNMNKVGNMQIRPANILMAYLNCGRTGAGAAGARGGARNGSDEEKDDLDDEMDAMVSTGLDGLDGLDGMNDMVSDVTGVSGLASYRLFLYIGTNVGTLMRVQIDRNSGMMSDKRERLIGNRPVKLFATFLRGDPAVVALCNRTWLTYTHQSQLLQTPLSYDPLEYVSFFSSEQCPEGMVSISRKSLKIFTLEKLGVVFNETIYPLRYTPRDMLIEPQTRNLIIIETDHRAYSFADKKELQKAFELLEMDDEDEANDENEDDMDMEMDQNGNIVRRGKKKKSRNNNHNNMNLEDEDEDDFGDETEKVDETFVGVPRADENNWASCIRILDPRNGRNLSILELEDNEACFSMTLCEFETTGSSELFLIIGTGINYQIFPRKVDAAYIRVYRLIKHSRLSLVHRTQVEDIPLGLCGYKGKLLAGIGKILRLYDIGKKQLLRKCENKNFPTMINNISVDGSRIYVSDIADGLHFAVYRENVKQIFVFADNTTPRHVTCMTMLDYDTIVCGDRFGNINISRFETSEEEGDERTMAFHKFASYLNGAPKKLTDVLHFHVGEMVTSLVKTRLSGIYQSESECIVYSTLLGSIGVIIPFKNKTDVIFFNELEMLMRRDMPPLLGRDHCAYRSYYFPSKACIDGDLCQQFGYLEYSKQKQIAQEIIEEYTPNTVLKKLERIRTSVL